VQSAARARADPVSSRSDPVGDLIIASRRVAAVQRALTDYGYGQLSRPAPRLRYFSRDPGNSSATASSRSPARCRTGWCASSAATRSRDRLGREFRYECT